jgi:hypothetical protein
MDTFNRCPPTVWWSDTHFSYVCSSRRSHRDTNDTACPGQHLYDALPRIRKRAKAVVDAYPAS